MPNCAICSVTEELQGNDQAFAFFPAQPLSEAHIVVAAREHRPTLSDITPSQAAAVLQLANALAVKLTPILGIEKFYLAAVGDVDLHFHLHLLPKERGGEKLGPYIFGETGWSARAPKLPGARKRITSAIGPPL